MSAAPAEVLFITVSCSFAHQKRNHRVEEKVLTSSRVSGNVIYNRWMCLYSWQLTEKVTLAAVLLTRTVFLFRLHSNRLIDSVFRSAVMFRTIRTVWTQPRARGCRLDPDPLSAAHRCTVNTWTAVLVDLKCLSFSSELFLWPVSLSVLYSHFTLYYLINVNDYGHHQWQMSQI